MTRASPPGSPIQKNARGNPAHDHSPDDRRHRHPAGEPGMDEARRAEKHHGKR